MYQGGTIWELEVIHVSNKERQIIGIFKKPPSEFVITCQLISGEDTKLLTTENFVSAKGWFSGQVRNIPITTPAIVGSFENDGNRQLY